MSTVDYFNLPWKDKWAWESAKLPTVTAKFVETTTKHAGKAGQLFNAKLYNGDSNGKLTWGDVYKRVEDYACGLMGLGLNKQDMARSWPRAVPTGRRSTWRWPAQTASA
jgi:long-chain acyl-CoA synthetase